jgi:hypothetical protein
VANVLTAIRVVVKNVNHCAINTRRSKMVGLILAALNKCRMVTWDMARRCLNLNPDTRLNTMPKNDNPDWEKFYDLVNNYEFKAAWKIIEKCRISDTKEEMAWMMDKLHRAATLFDKANTCTECRKKVEQNEPCIIVIEKQENERPDNS